MQGHLANIILKQKEERLLDHEVMELYETGSQTWK